MKTKCREKYRSLFRIRLEENQDRQRSHRSAISASEIGKPGYQKGITLDFEEVSPESTYKIQ